MDRTERLKTRIADAQAQAAMQASIGKADMSAWWADRVVYLQAKLADKQPQQAESIVTAIINATDKEAQQ